MDWKTSLQRAFFTLRLILSETPLLIMRLTLAAEAMARRTDSTLAF